MSNISNLHRSKIYLYQSFVGHIWKSDVVNLMIDSKFDSFHQQFGKIVSSSLVALAGTVEVLTRILFLCFAKGFHFWIPKEFTHLFDKHYFYPLTRHIKLSYLYTRVAFHNVFHPKESPKDKKGFEISLSKNLSRPILRGILASAFSLHWNGKADYLKWKLDPLTYTKSYKAIYSTCFSDLWKRTKFVFFRKMGCL